MKILARTPARISLFGGGTDLARYSQKYGGTTIALAINLYQNLTLNTGDDIFHGLTQIPPGASPELAYAILKRAGLGSWHFATLQSSFDGVIGAGLGSSGAFSVGLVAAIKAVQGENPSCGEIAEEAYQHERQLWTTGRQDHFIAAYGGLSSFDFTRVTIWNPFDRKTAENVREYLHLFYTGGTRASGKLQSDKLTNKKTAFLHQISDLTSVAHEELHEGNILALGELMDATWQIKKQLGVSTPKIDGIYHYAKRHGALGGKLLGAGGSGYMVFFVKPKDSQRFTKHMLRQGLEETDFSVDYNGVQTRIL